MVVFGPGGELVEAEEVADPLRVLLKKELPIEVVNSNKNTLIIIEEKIVLVVKDENQDREKIYQKGIREKLRQQSLCFIKKYRLQS